MIVDKALPLRTGSTYTMYTVLLLSQPSHLNVLIFMIPVTIEELRVTDSVYDGTNLLLVVDIVLVISVNTVSIPTVLWPTPGIMH